MRVFLLSCAAIFTFAAWSMTACTPAVCETDEAECVGSDQIQHCVDGDWGEVEDCPTDQTCMTMDSGLTHCMDMSGM